MSFVGDGGEADIWSLFYDMILGPWPTIVIISNSLVANRTNVVLVTLLLLVSVSFDTLRDVRVEKCSTIRQ